MERSVLYGEFKMPKQIKWKAEECSDTFARFVAEPFERGFGHTVGNSLRRMLLSSLESPAIISLCIEGVPHEYMAIDGIIEDMTNIVLNFKGALLRRLPMTDEPFSREIRILTHLLEITEEQLAATGQYKVTLRDIIKDGCFEVVNPTLHLFTVTKPMRKQVNLRIAIGRGYVPSERHAIEDRLVDEIIIDSAFSPVSLVNYWVENTRVGQETDYDRLIVEITTDGRVTPFEALGFADQIGIKHLESFVDIEAQKLNFDKVVEEVDSDHDIMMQKLSRRIDEIELSVRSTNCLNSANISIIAELVMKPESEMLKYRNFGKKSLNEIKLKLMEMGLGLGMDLSKYGINSENVKSVISVYLEERNNNKNG